MNGANSVVVNYNRNTLGQVIEVILQDGPGAPPQVLATGFAYEPMGPLKAFSYGNGLSFSQDWGSDRRLYAKAVKRADGSDMWAKQRMSRNPSSKDPGFTSDL